MLNIRIIFTNYDIIADFLNLAFCSEHFFFCIKHRILATFNINKKFHSDSLYAFKRDNVGDFFCPDIFYKEYIKNINWH